MTTIKNIASELLYTKHYCIRLLLSFYEFLWFLGLVTFIDLSNPEYSGLALMMNQNVLAGLFLLMSIINSGMIISKSLYQYFSLQFAFLNSVFWVSFLSHFNFYDLNASIIDYTMVIFSFFVLVTTKQNEAICKRLKGLFRCRK